ncbi:hypothetical protein J4233_06020 [Candidatus Pacearchaeota archaeon]|nr:hypothetical protein [Candidatus Pacearchaeota archaeon]
MSNRTKAMEFERARKYVLGNAEALREAGYGDRHIAVRAINNSVGIVDSDTDEFALARRVGLLYKNEPILIGEFRSIVEEWDDILDSPEGFEYEQ